MGDASNTVEAQKYAYTAQLMIFPALALSKISICLSYLRIFHADLAGRRMIQVLVVILVLSIIPFTIASIFQCRPIHVYWSEGRPGSKCSQTLADLYVNGSVNVVADIALIAIVLPRILHLQLNKRQKGVLISIVLIGSVAVIAGIVRMVRVGIILGKENFDPMWDTYDVSIWTSTEIYVSLICASALGAKPLVSKLIPKLLGTTLKSTSGASGDQFHSWELSPKLKQNAMEAITVRNNTSETHLTAMKGSNTEVGREGDADSFASKSDDQSPRHDEGIFKTMEITVELDNMNRAI